MKQRRMLDIAVGVPDGVKVYDTCPGCESRFLPEVSKGWTECPACGCPSDSDPLESVRAICRDCIDGSWGCSATDIAGMILDELPPEKG